MSTYNTFEEHIDEILKEATPAAISEPLNAGQRALRTMTGSPVFDGPGLTSNKYDPDKNYYPNIRRGWGKIFNIGEADQLDAANQAIIQRIEQLKQNGSPQRSSMYSPDYIADAEKSMKENVEIMLSVINSLPSGDSVRKILKRLQTTDISLISQEDLNNVKNEIESWIQTVESIISPPVV